MKSIFVSSTFRDMQAERDLLAMHVLPELNEFASIYAQSLQLIDLRWGVNTEGFDETIASRKVLNVCLDEIDNSRPYMIVLIGERYGWIPPEDLLKNAANEKKYDLLDSCISVTELEIKYGALSNKEQFQRCLFYFRKPLNTNENDSFDYSDYIETDPVNIDKLEKLKQKIISLGGHVNEYSCEVKDNALVVSDEFIDMVTQDVKQLFKKEFNASKNLSWQEKEENSAIAFSAQKASQFSARYDILDSCKEILKDEENQLFILQGNSGTGKSTLLSKLYLEYKDIANTLLLFCGNTKTQNCLDLVKQIVYKFESLLEITEHFEMTSEVSFKDYIEKIQTYASIYEERKLPPLYIFVDALDQLLQDETTEGFLWLPSKLPSCIKIVTSCTTDFDISNFHHLKDNTYVKQLLNLTHEERPTVIKSILSNNKKELSDELIDTIVSTEHSLSPLYLSMMLQRLIMLNSDDFKMISQYGNDMNAINTHIKETIKKTSGTIDELCANVLTEAAQRINPVLCIEVAKFLTVSRRGLRTTDLQALLERKNIKWNTLDFSLFVKYLKTLFIYREDGRIDFAHKSIRDGFMKLVDFNDYNRQIFDYLNSLEYSDTIKTSEILWHAYKNDDKAFISPYINFVCENHSQHIPTTKQELYKIAIIDEQWVNDAIKQSYVNNNEYTFASFLIHDFCNQFLPSAKEQAILLNLMLTAKSIAQYLEIASPSESVSLLVSDCDIAIGSIYEILNRTDKALEHYNLALVKSKEIVDFMEEDANSDDDFNHFMSSEFTRHQMQQQGISKEEMREFFNYRKEGKSIALKLYHTEIYRGLMLSYSKLSKIYRKNNDFTSAEFCLEQSLKINESLNQTVNDYTSERDLAISLLNSGFGNRDEGKLKEALENYLKAKEIFERIETDDDLMSKKSIVVVYNNIGDIYARLEKDQEKSNDAYKKAYNKALELVEISNKDEFYIDLIICLQRMACVFFETETEKSMQFVLKAIKYSAIAFEKMKTQELLDLIISNYKMSYSIKRNNNDYHGAISDCFKIIEYCNGFDDPSNKNKVHIFNNYITIGDCYYHNNEFELSSENLDKASDMIELDNIEFLKKIELEKTIDIYAHLTLIHLETDCYQAIKKIANKILNLTLATQSLTLFYKYLELTKEFSECYLNKASQKALLEVCDIAYEISIAAFEDFKDANTLRFVATVASFKGNINYHFRNLSEAFKNHKEATEIYAQLKNSFKDFTCCLNFASELSRIGDICVADQNLKGAIEYYIASTNSFYEAHQLAEDNSMLAQMADIYRIIADIYEQLGDKKNAKSFHKKEAKLLKIIK